MAVNSQGHYKEISSAFKRSFEDIDRSTLLNILRHMPYTVIVYNSEGTVIMANKAYLKLFGFHSENELIGKGINILRDMYPRKMGVIGKIKTAYKGKVVHIPELKISAELMRRNYGARITRDLYRQITLFPVFRSDRSIWGVVLMGVDITDLKSAQLELKASHERLKAFLESSSDIVQVVDKQGKFSYISPSVKKILGYRPEELIGKPSMDVVHPDDFGEVAKGFQEAIANPGKPVKTVCRCRHKNGTWRILDGLGINHLDNPSVQGYVANIRDVTEEKKNIDALREQEEVFRNIIGQSSDGIVLIDENGSIIEWNPSQEKITGLERSAVSGRKIWDVQFSLFPSQMRKPGVKVSFRKKYLDFLKTGKAEWLNKVLEVIIERPDGQLKHIHSIVFPIVIRNKKIYGSITRDATEIVSARKDILEREAALSAKNKLLQEKNVALREVMGQLEGEKIKVARQFQSNVNRLVLPALARLKEHALEAQKPYILMMEEALNDVAVIPGAVTDRSIQSLSSKELEVCNMIKQGMPSKQIARIMNISHRTVEHHRDRIRKKLGIADSNANLSTYLRTI